jgi:sugar/nucleoside kinase (ribokinase family)
MLFLAINTRLFLRLLNIFLSSIVCVIMSQLRSSSMEAAIHSVLRYTNFRSQTARPGEEVQIKKMLEVPGGKGVNVAIASSRLLKKSDVAIIAALGKDDIGEKQVSILKSEGVVTDLIYFVDNNIPSGRAM